MGATLYRAMWLAIVTTIILNATVDHHTLYWRLWYVAVGTNMAILAMWYIIVWIIREDS